MPSGSGRPSLAWIRAIAGVRMMENMSMVAFMLCLVKVFGKSGFEACKTVLKRRMMCRANQRVPVVLMDSGCRVYHKAWVYIAEDGVK